ncbi:hypothetical protein WME91_38945 [Sorangium sp. So ce269]
MPVIASGEVPLVAGQSSRLKAREATGVLHLPDEPPAPPEPDEPPAPPEPDEPPAPPEPDEPPAPPEPDEPPAPPEPDKPPAPEPEPSESSG